MLIVCPDDLVILPRCDGISREVRRSLPRPKLTRFCIRYRPLLVIFSVMIALTARSDRRRCDQPGLGCTGRAVAVPKVENCAQSRCRAASKEFHFNVVTFLQKSPQKSPASLAELSLTCCRVGAPCMSGTHAATIVFHRVLSEFADSPTLARSLERYELHSSKWEDVSTWARCSQYSASARSFQLCAGLYAAC
jgi:hypothetical protein